MICPNTGKEQPGIERRYQVSGLSGNRAVITGAASGLGRSLATTLAAEGWKIGIVDIDDAGAEETLELVRRAGGSGETFHADVSDPEEVKAFADHFFGSWGGVDLLVNNAGVVSAGIVGDIPLEDWNWIFGISFWGVLYGCHEFIPRFKAQGSGYIVNVSSSGGLICLTDMAPYNTVKAAVISLSETLAMELGPDRIGITVACPMFFKTNLLSDMRCTDDWEREWAQSTFDNARMTSDEVARRIIKAAKKNRLYIVPQLSGRIFWTLKRLMPGTFYTVLRFFNGSGLLKPLAGLLARWGLVQ
jgi:NAD(P)-dependent dehydrogenase (short-subunit alcohol dehydrogenase family)